MNGIPVVLRQSAESRAEENALSQLLGPNLPGAIREAAHVDIKLGADLFDGNHTITALLLLCVQ